MKCLSGLLDWREPQLLTGPCSVGDLPQRIKSQGIQRVLVVTDPGLARLGLPDAVPLDPNNSIFSCAGMSFLYGMKNDPLSVFSRFLFSTVYFEGSISGLGVCGAHVFPKRPDLFGPGASETRKEVKQVYMPVTGMSPSPVPFRSRGILFDVLCVRQSRKKGGWKNRMKSNVACRQRCRPYA